MHFNDLFTLSEKQREVLDIVKTRRRPIIGYGGSGGSGKSDLLRKGALFTCLRNRAEGFPGPRAVLATSTYTLLTDRHIHRLGDPEFRRFGRVKKSLMHGLAFHFHDEANGVIALRNLDDPDKYRGTESTAGVWIDEGTELPNKIEGKDTLTFLLYPIRRGRVDYPHMPLVIASNSDGVGHAWMKGAFITGSKRFKLDPARFHFVRALPEDNPFRDENWMDTLAGLPDWIRKARLEGSWDMPEGARFPCLTAERHMFRFVDRFPGGIPHHWRRWVSVDWGIRDPYAALWHTLDPAVGGKIYTYRGDYQSGVPSRFQAERVRERTGPNERIEVVRCDPSMWNKAPDYHMEADQTRDRAVIDDFNDGLRGDARFGPVVPGPRLPRPTGFNTLDTLLNLGLWEIEEGCQALWGELEAAVFNDTSVHGGKAEDIDPKNDDHALTCAIYGLHPELSAMLSRKEPENDAERARREFEAARRRARKPRI